MWISGKDDWKYAQKILTNSSLSNNSTLKNWPATITDILVKL